MVGLALKDQGIDVVAVGNGEAAVRKISDIKPDLVLADVFMPVRNGYEVCEYVKSDTALAHIPVILLVGAFDPLDEQEAQRVGADGVLKKPFVPPDPLISMVKSALARAGVPLGNEPEVVVPVKEEVPAFKPLAFQTALPTPAPAFEEPAIEDIPARPAPINIARGAQPLAFGSLLETQEDDTTQLVAPVRMERDWKSADEEEDKDIAEEEEENIHGWRPGATDWGGELFPRRQARLARSGVRKHCGHAGPQSVQRCGRDSRGVGNRRGGDRGFAECLCGGGNVVGCRREDGRTTSSARARAADRGTCSLAGSDCNARSHFCARGCAGARGSSRTGA